MGDNRPQKPMGCGTSMYVQSRTMRHYEGVKRLAAQDGRSFSEVINDSMKQVYFQQRTKVTISAEAYLAIANGDLSRLDIVHRSDGSTELIVDAKLPCPEFYYGPDRTFPVMDCRKAQVEGAVYLEQATEPVAKQRHYAGGVLADASQEAEPEGFQEDRE